MSKRRGKTKDATRSRAAKLRTKALDRIRRIKSVAAFGRYWHKWNEVY